VTSATEKNCSNYLPSARTSLLKRCSLPSCVLNGTTLVGCTTGVITLALMFGSCGISCQRRADWSHFCRRALMLTTRRVGTRSRNRSKAPRLS
jgi:hypothetical protein